MSNKIIVIGGDHHNTLGVIRSLGFMEINPHVIVISTTKNPYVLKSRYIESGFRLKDMTMLLEVLLNNFTHEGKKPIIIACSDAVASFLDLNKNILSEYFYFPCSIHSEGYLTTYMDKNKMLKLAKEIGLRTPKTWEKDMDIKFPCFIKPQISKNGSKADIARCYNQEDLLGYLSNHKDISLQIQEYIAPLYEYQLIGCSMNGGEQIIIPGRSIIIRSSETSNTGFLRYEKDGDMDVSLIEKCKTFIRSIGLSGLFSMEFLKGRDGNDYFLEINMRNDGNAICVTASGINLPYLWYLYNSDPYQYNKIISCLPNAKRVYVMPEFDDMMLVLRGKVPLWQWIKDIFKTSCFMEWCNKDPRPFFQRVIYLTKSKFKK
uniref:ATP-grasp domain-containing protein n=1 Tax=Alistipes sp. TaxID=1872444 RepID=UPI004056055E